MTKIPPEEAINFRYDVQSMIKNPELKREDKNRIRDHIEKECIGDCLLVIGMPGMIKVHFHTDEPEKLKDVLKLYGEIEDFDIEDMKEQFEAFKEKQQQKE
ncbi:MAG: kinase to dihydroxyacetone kinase [Candidatus Heimdallarchaeota archaeon]|nr:kinase to dihydroxyacetone kinase [Candidatus Heimdallarchaeota archaeon]MCK4955138.1 kinase to dihydroxyacetone kinase [Candidatus Heimdallarchaeota archaeon]